MIDLIVKGLNSGIASRLNSAKFAGSRFLGIACSYIKQLQESQVGLSPYIIDDNGEGKEVVIDDRYPLTIFHKNNGCSYKQDQTKTRGSEIGYIKSSQMSMILIASRRKLRLSPEMLEAYLSDNIPSTVDLTNHKVKASIRLQGSNFSCERIYMQEWQGATLISPDIILVEMKYQIDCTYFKGCVDFTCCN